MARASNKENTETYIFANYFPPGNYHGRVLDNVLPLTAEGLAETRHEQCSGPPMQNITVGPGMSMTVRGKQVDPPGPYMKHSADVENAHLSSSAKTMPTTATGNSPRGTRSESEATEDGEARLVRVSSRHLLPAGQLEVYKADFDRYDINKSGFIDRAEMPKLLTKQLGRRATTDEIKGFLQEFD